MFWCFGLCCRFRSQASRLFFYSVWAPRYDTLAAASPYTEPRQSNNKDRVEGGAKQNSAIEQLPMAGHEPRPLHLGIVPHLICPIQQCVCVCVCVTTGD